MTRELAESAYDVVVNLAGAPANLKETFVILATVEPRGEFRFMGLLGYGGKLWWHDDDGFRVSCYSEDETPYRVGLLRRTNEALSALGAKA